MDAAPIRDFEGFYTALLQAGFSLGGPNGEGIFTLCDRFAPEIRWHTGDPQTDPWAWRMRVLDERSDIAYAKVFFKKSGYITREWAPAFLAVRRRGSTLEEDYACGLVSHTARRIYALVQEYGSLAMHQIRPLGGFGREDRGAVERAVVELQMGMYLTLCGRQRKFSPRHGEYGWDSTVLCATEAFWGDAVMEQARKLRPEQAAERIAARVLSLHPDAPRRALRRFILG